MSRSYVGAGAYAGCAYCCVQGEYSQSLQKMVYLQHRSFLPSVDLLRLNHKNFPTKIITEKPTAKTMSFVRDKIVDLSASSTTTERKQLIQRTGCTGDYSLRRLPHHDRYANTPVEPMHLLKNIAERIVKLLSGLTDTLKVHTDEKDRKRFRSAWVRTDIDQGTLIPPAPFSFSKDQVVVANQRSKNVRTPSGVDWRPCQLFGKDASRLKSSEWKHVLNSGILKFCIRHLLGKEQERTLLELCDVISSLCAEKLDMQIIDSLEYRVHRVLSLMERDFPACIHVITLHLLHHLPMFVRRFGPLHGFWMYPTERFNNWIKNRVQNCRYPESTVVETYRLYELCFHLQVTKQLPPGVNLDITECTDCDSTYTYYDGSEAVQNEHVHGQGRNCVLDSDVVEDLNRLYMDTYPEYKNAVIRDRQKASDCEGQPLSHELCKGPNTSQPCHVTQYKVYSIKDSNNRLIRFGSVLSEHANSVHTSSYVHLRSSCSTFGRIQFIFDHRFRNKVHTFASVHWYDDAIVDQASGLIHVNTTINRSVSNVVHLRDISKPLVHAVDELDQDKLWFLNHDS